MGTLVKIRSYIFTIKNQSNLLHKNSIRLHYWRKTENFMENLKIRKYPLFTCFDQKITKVIQKLCLGGVILQELNRNYKIYAVLTLSDHVMKQKTHFSIFLSIFFLRGRGTILLNSVILKENFDGNIEQHK